MGSLKMKGETMDDNDDTESQEDAAKPEESAPQPALSIDEEALGLALAEKYRDHPGEAIRAVLHDRELVALSLALYDEQLPVADIMEKTGLSRTRLYNNLRKRGTSPNRKISNKTIVDHEKANDACQKNLAALEKDYAALKNANRDLQFEVREEIKRVGVLEHLLAEQTEELEDYRESEWELFDLAKRFAKTSKEAADWCFLMGYVSKD